MYGARPSRCRQWRCLQRVRLAAEAAKIELTDHFESAVSVVDDAGEAPIHAQPR